MEFAEVPKLVNISSYRSVRHLQTKIRDRNTDTVAFKTYASRLMTLICEEALTFADAQSTTVVTPTGATFDGISVDASQIVVISIIRAGDSMLETFMRIAPEASVGKILIQRDEETSLPVLFYSKVPDLKGKTVVVLDPMLATGGSAKVAIDVCVRAGADITKTLFVNVVASPQGINCLRSNFPDLTIVTGGIDEGLNGKNYIIPGLGDFGDRFFGTI